MAEPQAPRRPGRAVRLLLRAPIAFYHLHLGWLFGHRFLMLRHLGRTSGLVRETLLEVVHYDPVRRESIVVSAWGERSDWYRNIQRQPALEVWTGRGRYRPSQRFLDQAEATAVLEGYLAKHRIAGRLILRLFGYRAASAEDRHAFIAAVRLAAFRPTGTG